MFIRAGHLIVLVIQLMNNKIVGNFRVQIAKLIKIVVLVSYVIS